MERRNKPLVWLHGEVKTPPFSPEGRLEAGFLLRRLQSGERLGMPLSRPMPAVGSGCHELRVTDSSGNWRIIYRLDEDAVVILEIFKKKDQKTPDAVIARCKARMKEYEDA